MLDGFRRYIWSHVTIRKTSGTTWANHSQITGKFSCTLVESHTEHKPAFLLKDTQALSPLDLENQASPMTECIVGLVFVI